MIFFEQKGIAVPGEVLGKGKDLKAGKGAYKENEKVIAEKIGMVSIRNSSLKIIPLKGYYTPTEDDYVIGLILSNSLTSWRVFIRSTYPARLPASDFLDRQVDPEKEDIANYLSRGDVIYGQLTDVNRYGSSKITTSSSKFLGELKGGHLVKIKPPRVPRVIGKNQSMLSLLRKQAKVLVGDNGFIYIKTENKEKFKTLKDAIKMIERQAFTRGLTERIKKKLSRELG